METAAILRSFHGAVWTTQQTHASPERPLVTSMSTNAWRKKSFCKVSLVGRNFVSSKVNNRQSFLPYVKAAEAASAVASGDSTGKAVQVSSKEKNVLPSTFPSGFESLILGVCDETNVAELKVKVGDFEMHLRRNIGAPTAPTPVTQIVSPTTAPPIPSEPMSESASAASPVASQKSLAPTSPFTNVSFAKASKLAALEASGSTYVLVPSPTVGSFRKGRTVKGKKQPPSCKEGDKIKEGQVIGYVDQFGSDLPVRSDVAGEVLKILFDEGEAVGYGDPVVAVLPAFHGINT